jgi:hypothetical protein
MADLLTHVAVANLFGKATKESRVRAVFLVGTCVPDITYKGLLLFADSPTWLAEPSHAPLPLLALCYGLAMLFAESFRKQAFGALYLGGLLHILIDLGKSYFGQGVILLAFPFSMERYELGLYRPEQAVYMMAGAAVLFLATELVFRRTRPL